MVCETPLCSFMQCRKGPPFVPSCNAEKNEWVLAHCNATSKACITGTVHQLSMDWCAFSYEKPFNCVKRLELAIQYLRIAAQPSSVGNTCVLCCSLHRTMTSIRISSISYSRPVVTRCRHGRKRCVYSSALPDFNPTTVDVPVHIAALCVATSAVLPWLIPVLVDALVRAWPVCTECSCERYCNALTGSGVVNMTGSL